MFIKQSNSSRNDLINLPFFSLGFRCFFLAAGVYAIIAIVVWMAMYFSKISIPLSNKLISISALQWHAHEMIYGYSLAVIAGFLLTAVSNWTGLKTLQGNSLAVVFGIWLMARVLFLFAGDKLMVAGFLDIVFSLFLIYAISKPVIQNKQWSQLAIIGKVIILAVFNLIFYLGAYGIISGGAELGVYAGLYLVIGLILTMSRRVLPFFIENGVSYPLKLFNSKLLDFSSLLLFLAFFVSELFFRTDLLSASLALCLFFVNAIRLVAWHTPGIWRISLLWSLYIAVWSICIGFLLHFFTYFFPQLKYLAVHAFAFSGIGLITMSMMARVSLAHTGRDISLLPPIVSYALLALVFGVVFRVILPIFFMSNYTMFIVISQIFWLLAFMLFVIAFFPILTQAKVSSA